MKSEVEAQPNDQTVRDEVQLMVTPRAVDVEGAVVEEKEGALADSITEEALDHPG